MSSILQAMQRQSQAPSLTQTNGDPLVQEQDQGVGSPEAQAAALKPNYELPMPGYTPWVVWSMGISGLTLSVMLGASIFWGMNRYHTQIMLEQQQQELARQAELAEQKAQQAVAQLPKEVNFADIPVLNSEPVDLLSLQREALKQQSLLAPQPAPVAAQTTSRQNVATTSRQTSQPANNGNSLLDIEGAAAGSLAARFAQAVADTENMDWGNTGGYDSAPWLEDMDPNLTASVPPITFTSHVYSSDPSRRQISFNDEPLKEGDNWGSAKLVSIRRDDIVLRVNGHLARLEALTDWQP